MSDAAENSGLLANGTSSNHPTSSLHNAASRGDTDQLQRLIGSMTVAEINAKDDHGDTPLFAAVNKGSLASTQALLDKGAIVDTTNQEGDTALHVAAREDRAYITALLVEKTENVNLPNAQGAAALHLAAIRGHLTIVEKLCEIGADINKKLKQATPLHLAIKCKQFKIAMQLIEQGAELDQKDSDGNVPLHLAAGMDFVYADLIKPLVKKCKAMLSEENNDGNMPLHIAAVGGHYKAARLLIDHGSPLTMKNKDGDTPAHLACFKGYAVTAKIIIDKDKSMVNIPNNEGHLPLHKAVLNNGVKAVKMLLDLYAESLSLWHEFLRKDEIVSPKLMDMALDSGHHAVAQTLVQSAHWKTFLLTRHMSGKHLITPLRRLIEDMPDVAEDVMDRCLEVQKGHIIANFDLLDDRFNDWNSINGQAEGADKHLLSEDEESARIPADTRPYVQDVCAIKQCHPMNFIAETSNKDLIDHPLLQALLRRKWSVAVTIYLSFLLYYALFITLQVAFMIKAQPPFVQHACGDDNSTDTQDQHQTVLSAFVYIFAIIGMISELIQLSLTKFKHYVALHNLFDWFTYVTPVLVVTPFTLCGTLTEWQWQLGVACLFISCLNMLFFLRIIPLLGIYVMMVLLMLQNFLQFFTIMALFLVTFGLCFFLLLQNQMAFSTPFFSLMKFWVMMVGEMEFTETFHGHRDNPDDSGAMHYESMIWVLYIFFLVFLSLIVMNLLTSLAVSGVESLQDDSQHRIMALQIKLALNTELALPVWLQHRLRCVVKFKTFNIQKKGNKVWLKVCRLLQLAIYGSLCDQDIVKGALRVIQEREDPHNAVENKHKPLTKKDVEFALFNNTKDMHLEIKDIDTTLEEVEKRVKLMEEKVNTIHDTVQGDKRMKLMEEKISNIYDMLQVFVSRK